MAAGAPPPAPAPSAVWLKTVQESRRSPGGMGAGADGGWLGRTELLWPPSSDTRTFWALTSTAPDQSSTRTTGLPLDISMSMENSVPRTSAVELLGPDTRNDPPPTSCTTRFQVLPEAW